MKGIGLLLICGSLLAFFLLLLGGRQVRGGEVVITPLRRSGNVFRTVAVPTPGPSPAPTPDPLLSAEPTEETRYIVNILSNKFHLPDCSGAAGMKEENRRYFSGTRDEALARGFEPCGYCKP